MFISFQVDSKATDVYAGGAFRVELEKSAGRRPAGGLQGRALFFQLLTSSEQAQLLAQQNRIIRSLQHPPQAHIDLYPAGPVRNQYLSYFQPQNEFDAINCWLRVKTTGDVESWAKSIEPLLALMLERATELLVPETLYLGQGALLES